MSEKVLKVAQSPFLLHRGVLNNRLGPGLPSLLVLEEFLAFLIISLS